MDIKLTEERVLETAKKYGLSVKKSETPGFYIKGEKFDVDGLYAHLFEDFSAEEIPIQELISMDVEIKKTSGKLRYKNLTKDFDFNFDEKKDEVA
ncbi:hypothetical protein [Lentibacillus cibarius]|uniref:Uncharacterized protein n=1 Tax=Lentibacillus cibarius TaxID=2583219 RepID=A0A5S3QN59_9BACI|nr:hypothetical protein [Lentibacillus cibarius]TMN21926.1 hypothetical protein FFL34_07200 [Lentibacillus cibarius]